MSKDKDIWESYAATDPYYAVGTFDKYRSRNIDDAAKAEFFESGEDHIEHVFDTLERRFDVKLKPTKALDYGCGVGRLLIPLAGRCDVVTGVDISPRMLDEAASNLAERKLENVVLQDSEEFLRADLEKFDFVHTYIVVQHINPKIGYGIIRIMAERLETGGFGMIHVAGANPAGWFHRFRTRLYREAPIVYKSVNFVMGRTDRPMPMPMPMYEYSREAVYAILQESGCKDLLSEPTDHGMSGEMIFFRK